MKHVFSLSQVLSGFLRSRAQKHQDHDLSAGENGTPGHNCTTVSVFWICRIWFPMMQQVSFQKHLPWNNFSGLYIIVEHNYPNHHFCTILCLQLPYWSYIYIYYIHIRCISRPILSVSAGLFPNFCCWHPNNLGGPTNHWPLDLSIQLLQGQDRSPVTQKWHFRFLLCWPWLAF